MQNMSSFLSFRSVLWAHLDVYKRGLKSAAAVLLNTALDLGNDGENDGRSDW